MDIGRLKEHILNQGHIPYILEKTGCRYIRRHNGYYTCTNPDGDNRTAVTVYENDYLACVDYTRDISKGKAASPDIFTLVQYFKNCPFFEAVKLVCGWIDIDYYYDFEAELPESVKLARMILEMQESGEEEAQEKPLIPIPEKILSYYKPYVNDFFAADGISYQTQQLFEIGYDEQTNRITIPIRDELGNLVGVKGRLFEKHLYEDELKYLYIERCARSQILYGLYKTYPFIQRTGRCYVGEAEKSCMQLWDMGFCNAVATGGKKVSSVQIEKLTRLCTELVFLFDKDVSKDEMDKLAQRFVDGVKIFAVIDRNGILNKKEAPTDNREKFMRLMEEGLIQLK